MLADMARIAIIGVGNMGEALLSGLLRSGRQVKNLVVVENRPERARYLTDTYSVLVAPVADAVETADLILIAVKPRDVDAVVAQVAEAVTASDHSSEQVVVTVAAGTSTGQLETKLPAGTPVVRVMPNTPAQVGAGVSVLAAGRFATAEQLDEVAALFKCVGHVLTVPEQQMDAVTAVSGSGPAYFFLMIEALVDAAVAAGLARPMATELAVQTMAGAAEMLLDRLERAGAAGAAPGAGGDAGMDTTAAQLRAMVTSPGGTTAAALRELERGGLRTAVDAAVQAAKTHSEQARVTSE